MTSARRTLLGRALDRLTGRRLQQESHDELRREIARLTTLTADIARRLERMEKSRSATEVSPKDLRREMRGIRQRVEAVLAEEKNTRKTLKRIVLQTSAMVRSAYVATAIPAPLSLQARRFGLRSQNQEDGIILALLQAAGVTTRRFVDIGCGSSGGSAAVLAHDMGWSGLMVEARIGHADRLRRELAHNPGVAVVDGFVTPDNVNTLVAAHGLAGEIDFFSLDIDSTDYWVFEALEVCRPRVVVLEYNALFGPSLAVTVPTSGVPQGAPGAYAGASLSALESAARRKGYGLVLCEAAGINAFFLRDGLAPGIPRLTPAQAYRPRPATSEQEAPVPEDVVADLARAGLPLATV